MASRIVSLIVGTLLIILAGPHDGRVSTVQAASDDLVVVTPLVLSPATPTAGELVTASFSIRNLSGSPITLNRIGVGGRGPGCSDFACETSYRDFELTPNVTIGAGLTYVYQAQRSFPDAGAHFVQISYEQPAGSWHFLGSRIDFTVLPGMVVSEPLALSTTNPTTKDLVYANFTLRNDGSAPVTYLKVGIGGRGPDCVAGDWACPSFADYPWFENVTLAPGQSRRFSSFRVYGAPGAYFAQLSIQDSQGTWSNIGTRFDLSVAQATYSQRPTPIPFGVQWHPTWVDSQDDTALVLASSVGAKTLRLGVSWKLLEKAGKGQWGTGWYIPAVQRLIGVANSHGIDVQIMLLQVPCWASSDPTKDCSPEKLDDDPPPWDDAYPPANHQDYADAFVKLVQLYGGSVDTWEVWNEPNVARFWKPAPDAAAYSRLLDLAHDAIKAAQPRATVLGGSLAGADLLFLDAMYQAGAKSNFDALALHPYSGTRAPNDCSDVQWSFACGIDAARSMMVHENDPKPIYLTEFGWSTYSGQSGVSEATQAQYLQTALDALNVREYVNAVAWYTLIDTTFNLPLDLAHDNDFGLFTTAHRAKPAAVWLQSLQPESYKVYVPVVRR
jgi:hypothetical protein